MTFASCATVLAELAGPLFGSGAYFAAKNMYFHKELKFAIRTNIYIYIYIYPMRNFSRIDP